MLAAELDLEMREPVARARIPPAPAAGHRCTRSSAGISSTVSGSVSPTVCRAITGERLRAGESPPSRRRVRVDRPESIAKRILADRAGKGRAARLAKGIDDRALDDR